MKRIPRRIFVAGLGPREEFKREAIKLVNDQGLTIAEASKKLDTGWPKAIASKSLRTWMKQTDVGIDLAVSAFDVSISNHCRVAVSGAGDVNHVEIIFFNDSV